MADQGGISREFRVRRCIMGRLQPGEDVLRGLEAAAAAHGVRTGTLGFLGAIKGARLGFFDQEGRSYKMIALNGHLELASGVGNISLRDGKVFVHAHVTVSDRAGATWGGHLMEGSEVFACEYHLLDLEGEELQRLPDPATGLTLWG